MSQIKLPRFFLGNSKRAFAFFCFFLTWKKITWLAVAEDTRMIKRCRAKVGVVSFDSLQTFLDISVNKAVWEKATHKKLFDLSNNMQWSWLECSSCCQE